MNDATFTVRAEAVGSDDAVPLLRAYFEEIISRYWHREATAAEVHAELADDPSDDLAPPEGVFLILREGGRPIGCVGLRTWEPGIVELKRMFVRKEGRGRGAGRRLVAAAEAAGRGFGARSIRLDTRNDLVEARALYTACGYVEIPAYHHGPYAEHWFERQL